MKKLSKLSLSDPLSREELKKIKGGGEGLCWVYCMSGGIHMVPYGNCLKIASKECGGEVFGCSDDCEL